MPPARRLLFLVCFGWSVTRSSIKARAREVTVGSYSGPTFFLQVFGPGAPGRPDARGRGNDQQNHGDDAQDDHIGANATSSW